LAIFSPIGEKQIRIAVSQLGKPPANVFQQSAGAISDNEPTAGERAFSRVNGHSGPAERTLTY
jgi:hypothetical protein